MRPARPKCWHSYGITEATMGCPLISQLEVVSLGKTSDGIEAFMDKVAYESDGVMLVGRVKWHTDFAGKIESGLFKMMAIGLGKFAGAQRYHAYAYRLGPGTRDPQRGPAGTANRARSWAAWRFWKTPTTTPPSSTPSRWKSMERARRRTWRW